MLKICPFELDDDKPCDRKMSCVGKYRYLCEYDPDVDEICPYFEPKFGEWVPYKKIKPKKDGWYLVCNPRLDRPSMYRFVAEKGGFAVQVTAWMPLPEVFIDKEETNQ